MKFITYALAFLALFFFANTATHAKNKSRHYNDGAYYGQKRQYDKARKSCKKAHKKGSNPAKYCLTVIDDVLSKKIKQETADHIFRAMSYEYKSEYKRMVPEYNRAIELNPDYAISYFKRGAIFFVSKNYTNAINDFSKAIELDPNNSDIYTYRSLTYSVIRKNALAMDDLNKAIELNPKNNVAYMSRGRIYLFDSKFRNTKKGCQDIKKSCDLGNCQIYRYTLRHRICKR